MNNKLVQCSLFLLSMLSLPACAANCLSVRTASPAGTSNAFFAASAARSVAVVKTNAASSSGKDRRA